MLNLTASPTVTSIEIAELTGKQHGHVLRDIEIIIKQLTDELDSELEATPNLDYVENQGFTKEVDATTGNTRHYNLTKVACDLVVSGYSVKYRLAIIKRWHELEYRNPTLPTTFDPLPGIAQASVIVAQAINHDLRLPE